jgi:isopentenyl-diphosphate delta-isomerase
MATQNPPTIPLDPRLGVRLVADRVEASGWALRAAANRLFVEASGPLADFPRDNVRLQIDSCATEFITRIHNAPIETSGLVELELTDQDQSPAFDAMIATQRKIHHIDICQKQDVESSDRDNGLSHVTFMPCALPDLDWEEIDTRVNFLGKEFLAPVLITGMTGGVAEGRRINHTLARAACAAGIPMGVGSQRLALEDPRHAQIFDVKKEVPGVFLIGNIGAAQLAAAAKNPRAARELCLAAVEMIAADALAIHVNILQELVQVEGDRKFRGVKDAIAAIASDFPVPVVVKEVGAGMDPSTVSFLAESGVSAIDVGGRGGTSWGWIEGLRSRDPQVLDLARTFRDWGLTTGKALELAVQTLSKRTDMNSRPQLIATGGMRSGLDVARAVAMGATMTGFGLPLFRAALQSSGLGADPCPVTTAIDQLVRGLKTVMMCTGSRKLKGLQRAVITEPQLGNLT